MVETISYMLIYIVEAIIACQYFFSVFETNHSKKTAYLVLNLGYFVMFAISKLGFFWINTLSFFLINMLCIYILFKADIKKAIFHSLILTVAMNVTELVMLNVLAWICNDFSGFYKDFTYFILLAISSKILYYLVIQLIIHLFKDAKETSQKSGVMTILLCTVPVISMWITLTFIFIGFEGKIPSKLNWLIIISAFFMLLINVCVYSIYAYMLQINDEHLQTQLQLQKESADAKYYKMLMSQSESQKILIHDIKKHLHSIMDLLDKSSDSSAKDYIQQMLQSEALKKELNFCNHTTMNLILTRYQEICQKNKIQLIVDIRQGTLSFMNMEDISALFGNLLENAVEVASGIASSYIELSVKYIGTSQLLISMINSCNKVPQLSSSGEYISTKHDSQKHGLGLKSIKKIVKKYQGTLNTYYFKEDQTFHTVITIYQQKDKSRP